MQVIALDWVKVFVYPRTVIFPMAVVTSQEMAPVCDDNSQICWPANNEPFCQEPATEALDDESEIHVLSVAVADTFDGNMAKTPSPNITVTKRRIMAFLMIVGIIIDNWGYGLNILFYKKL